MEAAKGVGLVQFLRACFMRRNRGCGKAGTVVIDSYGSCSLWSMIVDVWGVVTFGRGLRRPIRPADETGSQGRLWFL
jgi:hypothetical protein